jgi:hypothetical protein
VSNKPKKPTPERCQALLKLLAQETHGKLSLKMNPYITPPVPKANSEPDESRSTEEPALLTVDGKAYLIEGLSERARLLSLDCVRTEQEWLALQHRYRQFVAMEATVVKHLKEEVEKSGLEQVWSTSESSDGDLQLLTIDDKSYDANMISDAVRCYVEDLMHNSQERSQLEFRLRQLDAASSAFHAMVREELEKSGAEPLDSQDSQNK